MGATFAEPRTLGNDKPLTLRDGLWIHSGLLSAEVIEGQFEAFGKMEGLKQ